MNSSRVGRLTGGLVLIAVGILFFLNMMGWITISIRQLFATFWPVLLIFSGLMTLIFRHSKQRGEEFGGIILLCVGTIFLLRNLDLTPFSIGQMFQFMIPVVLVYAGIQMIFSRKRKDAGSDFGSHYGSGYGSDYDSGYGSKYGSDYSHPNSDDNWQEEGKGWNEKKRAFERKMKEWEQHSSGSLHSDSSAHDPYHQPAGGPGGMEYHYVNNYKKTQNKSGFIGDFYIGKDYWELTPMNISSFIGDTFIDLTKASIPAGETKITVSAFIGDVKIIVPADLDIEIKVTASSFIGDMKVLDRHEDGMMRSMSMQTPYYQEGIKKIKLNVSMFIGDVVVKKIG
ncbi:cell wall-active antibiotics response protein LiaF [Paenibacillus sp. FJAT-26967]|uniref:cell wall-active antibiotics response protein LiaF n=1 Tax=Paenibacillus sp. FJAT-26967 TaxID=1729690 RepID=UPI0008397D6E|nr:cell wall-active antibiotics response protein LiaF [Paenibacillus sp. FJAT-26967]